MFHVEHSRLACLRNAGRVRPRPPGRVYPLPAFLKFPGSPGAGAPAPRLLLLVACSLLAVFAGRAVPARLPAPFGAEKGGLFGRFASPLACALSSLFLKVNTI